MCYVWNMQQSTLFSFLNLILFCHCPCNAEENDPLCGAECLYMIHVAVGRESKPFTSFLARMPAYGKDGFSFDQLKAFSTESGVTGEFASLNEVVKAGLSNGQFAIVHKKPGHFQILAAVSPFSAQVLDPNGSSARIPLQDFLDTYSSNCLLVGDVKVASIFWSSALWGWICILVAISATIYIVYRSCRRSGIFGVVVLCLTFAGCGTNRSPRFSCDSTSKELGLLQSNVNREIQFAIKNTGNAALIISDITTSCGCAKVQLSRRQIEPAQQALMRVEIRPSETGPRSATIKIRTNDTTKPIASFSAEWSVGEKVGFSMYRILASLSDKVRDTRIEFRVLRRWQKDWKYLIESNRKELPFTVEANHGERMHNFVAKLVHLEPGVFEGTIKIVDTDSMVLAELPWVINIIPSLRVHPGVLTIDANRGASQKLSLLVEAPESSSIRVEGEAGNSLESVAKTLRQGVYDVSLNLTDKFNDSRIRVFAEDRFIEVEINWLNSEITGK